MVLTVLFSGDRLSAAPVDANQAKAMAESFLRSASQNQRQWRAPALNQLSLAYTQVDQTSGKNAFFVFNCGQQKGYVMVAADDRAPAILGYADKGAFDGKRIPQSMKGMIHSWTAQIAWLANHNECKAYSPVRPVSAVEPLLGDIMWDQGNPYNRTSKSHSDAIDAVSTLMYHVGAAVQSVYGYSTGAYDFEVAPAMMKYFSTLKGNQGWRQQVIDLNGYQQNYSYICIRFLGRGVATTPLMIDNLRIMDSDETPDGIASVKSDADNASAIYDLSGRKILNMQSDHVYLIRNAEGKVSKVVR